MKLKPRFKINMKENGPVESNTATAQKNSQMATFISETTAKEISKAPANTSGKTEAPTQDNSKKAKETVSENGSS